MAPPPEPEPFQRPMGNLIQLAGGASVFSATLGLSQLAQHQAGITAGKRILGCRALPSALGACSVALGSVLSVRAVELSRPSASGRNSLLGALPAALLGVSLYFVAAGGKLWAISPSCVASLGSFSRTAQGSLDASLRYATLSERETIQHLGRKFGCHTCGAWFRRLFHADHMPPVSEVTRANARFWRRWSGWSASVLKL